MTFVGKVLIGLQLALSLFLMAFAGAVVTVQNDWHQKAKDLEEQLAQSDSDMNRVRTEFEQQVTELTTQLQTQTDKANQLEAVRAGLAQQVQSLRQENETVKSERDTQRAIAEISGKEAEFRKQEAIKQRALNTQLYKQQDELIATRNDLETEIFKQELEQKDLLAKHERVLQELSDLRTMVAQAGVDIDPQTVRAQMTPPPVVDGLVEDTQKSSRGVTELVQISIGSDDGLVEGHEVYVYRTGLDNESRPRYLGKIKLVNVQADHSVGTVIERPKNGIIERGDNVTTKL